MAHANLLKISTVRVYLKPLKTVGVALIVLVSNGQGEEWELNRQQQDLLSRILTPSLPSLPPRPSHLPFFLFCLSPFPFPSYYVSQAGNKLSILPRMIF